MNQPDATQEARRREFGAFLRSRRQRLTPAGVGLPDGFRRRTPGLRREEVAQLAGVGTTWYTWLEQGRDVRPSAEVLSALAKALRLDATERRHLFGLNNPPVTTSRSDAQDGVDAPLRRLLASLTGQPAYVTGRYWEILAWNRAAEVVFGDYGRLRGDARNIMHLVFIDPDHRRLLVDWQDLAPVALAMFRADCAKYAGDPVFDRLVAGLIQDSPEFRAWWPRHEVLRHLAGHKRVDHPVCGRMLFEHTNLTVADSADLHLVVYTPLEEEETDRKLASLLCQNRLDTEEVRI